MDITTISTYKDNKILYNHIINHSPDNSGFDLHTHDICELIFLKKGNVSGIINGKTYKLQQNDLIIFRPRVLHGIQIDTNKEYERINILFDEKEIANEIFEKVPNNLDVINYTSNNYIIDILYNRKVTLFYCIKSAFRLALHRNFLDENFAREQIYGTLQKFRLLVNLSLSF